MNNHTKPAIAGLFLGLILGISGTAWWMMKMQSQQTIQVDYVKEI